MMDGPIAISLKLLLIKFWAVKKKGKRPNRKGKSNRQNADCSFLFSLNTIIFCVCLQIANYRLPTAYCKLPTELTRYLPSMTTLVFFTATTRTRLISTHFLFFSFEGSWFSSSTYALCGSSSGNVFTSFCCIGIGFTEICLALLRFF